MSDTQNRTIANILDDIMKEASALDPENGSPQTDPGGYTSQGNSSPMASVDNGTTGASTGSHAAEVESKVKKEYPASVDNTAHAPGGKSPTPEEASEATETGTDVPSAATSMKDPGGRNGATSSPMKLSETIAQLRQNGTSLLEELLPAVINGGQKQASTPEQEPEGEAQKSAQPTPEETAAFQAGTKIAEELLKQQQQKEAEVAQAFGAAVYDAYDKATKLAEYMEETEGALNESSSEMEDKEPEKEDEDKEEEEEEEEGGSEPENGAPEGGAPAGGADAGLEQLLRELLATQAPAAAPEAPMAPPVDAGMGGMGGGMDEQAMIEAALAEAAAGGGGGGMPMPPKMAARRFVPKTAEERNKFESYVNIFRELLPNYTLK